MKANYHTHTYRCGHATGSDEQYIETAWRAGIKKLGFSDHSPQPFSGGYYTQSVRMRPETLGEYAETIRRLKNQYGDRIEIHLGVEAEYYPALFSKLLAQLRDNGVEYMILGQHWCGNEEGFLHNICPTDNEQQLRMYCDQVIEGIQTGMFTYIAHPDIFCFVGEDKAYERHMTRLCREAKSCDIPLEINLLGLGDKRNYPSKRFWRIAAQEGNRVILGRDAHNPDAFLDCVTVQRAKEFAKDLDIMIEEDIVLKRI